MLFALTLQHKRCHELRLSTQCTRFYNSAGCLSLINTSPSASFHRTGTTAHRATPDWEKNSRCSSSQLQSWPDSTSASSCGKKQAFEKLIKLFFIVMNSTGANGTTSFKATSPAGAHRNVSVALKHINVAPNFLLLLALSSMEGTGRKILTHLHTHCNSLRWSPWERAVAESLWCDGRDPIFRCGQGRMR